MPTRVRSAPTHIRTALPRIHHSGPHQGTQSPSRSRTRPMPPSIRHARSVAAHLDARPPPRARQESEVPAEGQPLPIDRCPSTGAHRPPPSTAALDRRPRPPPSTAALDRRPRRPPPRHAHCLRVRQEPEVPAGSPAAAPPTAASPHPPDHSHHTRPAYQPVATANPLATAISQCTTRIRPLPVRATLIAVTPRNPSHMNLFHQPHTPDRVNSPRELQPEVDRCSDMGHRHTEAPRPPRATANSLGVPGTAGRIHFPPAARTIVRSHPRRPAARLLCVSDTGLSSSPAEGAFADAQAKLTCPLSAFPVRREEARSP